VDEVYVALREELRRHFPIYGWTYQLGLHKPYINMLKAGRKRPISVLTIKIEGAVAVVSWTPPPMRAIKTERVDLSHPQSLDDLIALVRRVIKA
jgi:hypothetical protein